MEQNGKDAFWFSHDSNAKDDPKCVLLIDQLGLEGYGIYWVLVEILREQPELSYPMALLPAIAKRYGTSAQKVEAVVTGFGLFEIRDDKFFYSPSLITRILNYKQKKDARTAAALKANSLRWEKEKSKNLLPESERNPNGVRTESERNPNLSQYNIIKEKETINTSSLHSEVSPSQNELEPRQSENDDLFQGENEADAPSEEKLLSRRQCQQVIDFWNRSVASKQSGLPSVKTLTEDRMAKIRVRWREFKGIGDPVEICKTIFEKANGSKFMAGDNKSGWKASFDWLFTNGKNWTKVYEGNYDDRELNIGSKVASSHNLIDKWNN